MFDSALVLELVAPKLLVEHRVHERAERFRAPPRTAFFAPQALEPATQFGDADGQWTTELLELMPCR